MQLNMHIIRDGLAAVLEESHLIEDFRMSTLTHAELLEHGHAMAPTVLYVAQAGELPPSPSIPPESPVNLVVCGTMPSSYRKLRSCNWISLPCSTTTAQALRLIQGVFTQHDEWERTLRDLALNGGSVSDMLRCSTDIFKAEIVVHDEQFRIIGIMPYEGEGSSAGNDGVESPLNGEYFSPKQIRMVMDLFRSSSKNSNPFAYQQPHSSNIGNGSRDLSLNVWISADYLIRINISRPHDNVDVSEKNYPLIRILGLYIKLVYLLYPYDGVSENSSKPVSLLRSLLQGHELSKRELARIDEAFGWDGFTDRFQCMVAAPCDMHAGNSAGKSLLVSIWNRIQAIDRDCTAIIIDDKVVLIANLTKMKRSKEEYLTRLRGFIDENILMGGLSSEFAGIRHAHTYYRQALTAWEQSVSTFASKPGLHSLNDLAFSYLYNCVQERHDPRLICPDGIFDLLRYDEKHQSNLYTTMKTYLECGSNAVRAAEELAIERSTFYYRLNKALSILDMDISDSSNLAMLLLSFRIIEAAG